MRAIFEDLPDYVVSYNTSHSRPRIIRFVVFIDPHQGLIMLTDAVD